MSLNAEFNRLEEHLNRLIALLDEDGETFWSGYLRRGLAQVKAHRLSGATFVLGCFGGQDTFSDLTLGEQWASEEPLRVKNLNERLTHLRTEVFQSANNIASRKLW
jgi:hypothetical protein